MMATKRRVRDMLLRLKTPVAIQDTAIYKRLTIRINHQGVSVRDTEIGAKIGTKNQFRVCAGDFILSKIDARQGAFGIVPLEADDGIITGNFWTYRVDNQIVDTEWFLLFTTSDTFLDLCKRSSTGNTHRKYLNEAIFLNHELEIPSLEEQRKAVISSKAGHKRADEIQHEITHQQSLLAKFKQAILQEAIQGKLTSDWRAEHPCVEPASHLLHQIQAKKAHLIVSKKIRRAKPLSKISPDEIPFEIPKDWEWCRLGVISSATIGLVYKPDQVADKGVPVLRANSIVGSEITLDGLIKVNVSVPNNKIAQPGDILVCVRSGSKALIGKCAIIKEAGLSFGAFMTLLRSELNPYIFRFLQSSAFRTQIDDQKSTGINQLTQSTLNSVVIPIPPLPEQAAIVERVEELMATCLALEAEIEQARNHAAQFLQAELKEAFAPAAV